MKRALWVLWPSFVVAGGATAFVFAFIDPTELPFELPHTAAYSVGFFFFWALAAASSGLTCLLQRRP